MSWIFIVSNAYIFSTLPIIILPSQVIIIYQFSLWDVVLWWKHFTVSIRVTGWNNTIFFLNLQITFNACVYWCCEFTFLNVKWLRFFVHHIEITIRWLAIFRGYHYLYLDPVSTYKSGGLISFLSPFNVSSINISFYGM
jgi:hypothetical protein